MNKKQTNSRRKHLRQRILKGIGLCLLLLCTVAASVWYWYYHRPLPQPVERTLYNGVTYKQWGRARPVPMVIQLVTIDLKAPGIRFYVTAGTHKPPLTLRAQKTTDFLRETGAQLAINADFFWPWHSHSPFDYYPRVGDPVAVQGTACSDGNCYSQQSRFPSLFLTGDNQAWIGFGKPKGMEPWNVVSGIWMVLQDGHYMLPEIPKRDPRTAVGLDKGRRHLYLLVIDGRQPNYSEGATPNETADLLREAGADTALMLDGGGSATLAVRDDHEQVRILNSPIDCHIPGRERPVANHLAIFAQPAP